MFERLTEAADHIADRALVRIIRRMAARVPPKGVELESLPDGIVLKGRRLKRRMIDNAMIRNFLR